MHNTNNRVSPLVAAISVAVGFAFVGFAAELYVSESGTYRTDDGVDHEAYTNLQAAIDAAANKGDKIWVEDNFVCTSEATSSARLNIAKTLTISSRSGKWENGITVTANSTRRCINVTKTGGGASQVNGDVRLIGFKLTGEGQTVNQGAVNVADGWARFDLENSAVIGFTGKEPVFDSANREKNKKTGIAISTIRNCVISNNVATATGKLGVAGVIGGSVYDTVFACNYGCGDGSSYASSDTCSVVSNCVFVCNTNGNANAGGALCCSASDGSFRCYDTDFIENTFTRNITHGSGARGFGTFVRCNFVGNGHRQCCAAVEGGLLNKTCPLAIRLFDCVVSNNFAEACGGVYNVYATNTVIACNRASASGYGGGAFDSYLVDCDLIANSCVYGAGARACVLVNCRVCNNTNAILGAGAYFSVLTNCLVSGNRAERTVSSGDMGGGGLAFCTATVCRVTGNTSIRNGAGTLGGLLTNCLIDGNTVDDPALHSEKDNVRNVGTGGGAYASDLVECVVSNNVAWYRGAGFAGKGTTKNCIFVDNRLTWDFNWNNGQYMNGGSAVMGGTHYNALITRNIGVGKYGSTISSWTGNFKTTLVNCTVCGNESAKASGGIDDKRSAGSGLTVLVNTVVAGNTGAQVDSFKVATNSYVTAEGQDKTDVGCIYGNEPKLGTVEGFAYTPLGGSKCKNNALKLDWMTNETDVCSKDIYGHDRIIGSAPDIGAVERKGYGIMLMVR